LWLQLPGTFPGTFVNRNPGVPLFAPGVNPNCHCYDPTDQLLLNPAAFTDSPAGQWSSSTPFYNDFRWMREPMENMGFGRIFAFGKEGRYNIEVRGEFTNIFNRHFFPAPSETWAAASTCTGNTSPAAGSFSCPAGQTFTGGYGFAQTAAGAGAQPRAGQFVARFRF